MAEQRRGEPASKTGAAGFKGVTKEMAEEKSPGAAKEMDRKEKEKQRQAKLKATRGIRGLRATGQEKAGWQFHATEISIPMTKEQKAQADKETGVRRSKVKKRTLRKAPPKKRSPTDAEREVVASGKAMFNERGREALREESIGTKLRSFGRGLKRKITGRRAANRGSGRGR